MISGTRLLLTLLIVSLPFVLMGCQDAEKPVFTHQQKVDSAESLALDKSKNNPVINLLGKSFDEIILALGEPDEQGYSGWLGPHYYILYNHQEGVVRFCSPEHLDNKIAVSIFLGPGQEVFGAKVGMTFPEIQDILGTPDSGPVLGMDNLYYMDYFIGEITNQVPEVFISFSADTINSPTHEAFIKWEAFDYDQMEILQAAI